MGGGFQLTAVDDNGLPLDGTVGPDFVWDDSNGAQPEDGWEISRENSIKKTKYPGSDEATFQLSGPTWGSQEIKGMWADRLGGGPGFAIATKEAFLAFSDRNTLVRIEHEEESFYGYVKAFKQNRKHKAEIHYSFEFWPARRRIGLEASASAVQRRANPAANRTPLDLLSTTEVFASELDTLATDAPLLGLAGGGFADIVNRLGTLARTTADIRRTIELQAAAPDPESLGGAALALARAFGGQRAYGEALLAPLQGLSSADVVAWDSPENFCGFESWCRLSGGQTRLLVLASWEAEREMQARAQPDQVRVHYPYAGEHLYSIARLYGVEASAIIAKNNLETLTFDGSEVIEIPGAAR